MHMILVYDTTFIMHGIINLLFYSISIQICVQDLLKLNVSCSMRYDIVSTYDTLVFFSSLINYHINICVDLICMILAMILALWLALYYTTKMSGK
jgi:hypothetical protein